MSAWSAIAVVAVVAVVAVTTDAIWAGVIVALVDPTSRAPVGRALRYVGPAVLAALAVNPTAGGEGGPSFELADGTALAVAGAVAGALAWWRRYPIWTLVVGMAAL